MPRRGGTRMGGVACTSTTNCFAVGTTAVGQSVTTLIERWNGTSWSLVNSPNRNGKNNLLNAVSCPRAQFCFAVGVSYGQVPQAGAATLIERWNGSGWAIATSPTPSGSLPELDDVSCATKTRCLAVGQVSKGNKFAAVVERWDGKHWTIVPSPLAAGQASSLSGITCTAPTNCIAVGSLARGSLIERWNGTKLTRVASPNPAGSTTAALASVSCASPGSCFTVGELSKPSGPKLFTERWNGQHWTVVPYPGPDGPMNSVDCPAATRCFAAGGAIGRWDGADWTLVQTAQGASQSNLDVVGCSSTTDCIAIGAARTTSTVTTLAERWNGTSWSVVNGPARPAGALSVAWNDVSCTSTTNCIAVGNFYTSSAGVTTDIAERWDGTSWSSLTTPLPAGTTSSTLNGVECPTATTCFAVGSYNAGSGNRTLVEQWNGTTWTIVASPNPSGASSVALNDLSCASAMDCFAVGSADVHTLTEHWNGTSWSVVASPDGPGTGGSELLAVSCPTATTCFAVGQALTEFHLNYIPYPFIEQWDGTSWSVVESPSAGIGALTRVSCTSDSNCVALGGDVSEQWDGSAWSTVTFSLPSGANIAEFDGLSCPSATTCYGVGSYSTNTSRYTLVEQLT